MYKKLCVWFTIYVYMFFYYKKQWYVQPSGLGASKTCAQTLVITMAIWEITIYFLCEITTRNPMHGMIMLSSSSSSHHTRNIDMLPQFPLTFRTKSNVNIPKTEWNYNSIWTYLLTQINSRHMFRSRSPTHAVLSICAWCTFHIPSPVDQTYTPWVVNLWNWNCTNVYVIPEYKSSINNILLGSELHL